MPLPDSMPVLSVAVPAFNEQQSIAAVLDHLLAQQEIDEIVVVDNASTDATASIVADYSRVHDRIVVLDEPRPGIAWARNTGFDHARGQIIARTDADTFVAPGWARAIRQHLTSHPGTAALTGPLTFHDSPLGFFLKTAVRLQQRRGRPSRTVANMFGANMAIRASAWQQVRADVCMRADIVEDLDLALCVSKQGLRIDRPVHMHARTSARRYRTPPRQWWRYQQCGLRTIANQGYLIQPSHHVLIVRAWLAYTIQWPIYRFWNFERRRFTPHASPPRTSTVHHLRGNSCPHCTARHDGHNPATPREQSNNGSDLGLTV
ncbi:glycosyltransferase [Nocardia nova]|uniref:glycosyltransferase n=1 Tax=Nocardia nova TaxID=37330 RepID=UPI000CEA610A|nr:glycosyltransferase family 2 protein [Nocardia nova]PPJ27850.1 glycosyl transferase family 2 [Nocardia nova]